MGNSRKTVKGDVIQDGEWQALYTLTKHWKSDLLFYRDDLKFLRHLEDTYFLWIKAEDHLESMRKIGEKILRDTRVCNELLQEVDKHLNHLAQIVEGLHNNDQRMVKRMHTELKDDVAKFVKNTRESRKQLFKITEYAMVKIKSEHPKN